MKVINPNTLSAYISSLIFFNNNIITKYQNDIFDIINDKVYYIDEISRNFQNEFFSKNSVKYIECKIAGLKIDIIKKPERVSMSSMSDMLSSWPIDLESISLGTRFTYLPERKEKSKKVTERDLDVKKRRSIKK